MVLFNKMEAAIGTFPTANLLNSFRDAPNLDA